ncbi:glycoside hydrolase family 105 protein [Paenibacillus sp. GCM10027626]|uniref:glycoside hydrolase family 88/105 protein n=1 Tax=Paenibacillus sp. GCM10027626 TaxID=3273411 RepID=UPI003632270F
MTMTHLKREHIEALIEKVIQGLQNLTITIEEDTPVSIISMNQWDWSQGVALFSLYLYYKETGNRSILHYLSEWFDHRIREGLPPKNVNTMCPMLTLSYLYEETRRPDYLEICEEWVCYAVDEMPRTPEFGIPHLTLESCSDDQLRDDTLYMTVLFIGRMGVMLRRDYYIQESIRQFLVHQKYLADKKTGLFYHGWSFIHQHNFAGAFWGRGNAWYMAGLVDFLDMVRPPMGIEMFLLSSLERQIQALHMLQTANGLWRTILNDETAYEETSATAGFAYGILKAVRKGYISEDYRETGLRALFAVIEKIDSSGIVQGVSYGTRIGWTLEFYKKIPQCPTPYGQSMTLLMLVECLQHFDEQGLYEC